MNRNCFRPSIDPGLLLCLLLTLFLALPLTQNPRLPNSAETLLQSADGALLLLCFALCSGGIYSFCKRRGGRLGALIAGLVYVYSPYLIVDTPFARGAYSELLALALFPLLLWRLDALRDKPTPSNFLLACFMQAAAPHTHFETALLLTVIALAWLGVETLVQLFNREASQMRARCGALAALALLLGLLASANASAPIMPADAATDQVFRAGYFYLEDLLAPPPIQDAGALYGLREATALGLAQWALALLGALAALWLYIDGYRTRHPNAFLGSAFFGALAVLLIALMQPSAAGLWRGSSLLQQLGAPSRLLGPTAACLAIVASMNGLWLRRLKTRYQISTIAIVVALPIVTAIPLLYIPEWQPVLETASGLLEPAGQISGLAAAFALLFALALAWRLRSWRLTPRPYWTTPALARTSAIGILLGGGIALLSLLITFREGVVWLNSPPGEALPAQVQRVFTVNENVQLLGYDLNAEVFGPGDRLVFSAYWHVHERPSVDYSSILYLSAGGPPQMLAFKLHPAGRPTSESWGPEGYVVDNYDLRLPADISGGEYDLIIALAVCDGLPLDDCAATDAAGAALGGSVVIATIRVEAS